MKTSALQAKSGHSTMTTTLLGVVFATGLAAMTVGSALAQENDRRNSAQPGWQDDNHQQSRATQRAQPGQHDRVRKTSNHQERQSGYEQRYQQANRSYGYADPAYVYAPPPVVYEPRPSPGISLFFSL